MVQQSKQIFLSHCWKEDELGRKNHTRVSSLTRELRRLGWSTWFDEDDMLSLEDMDASISQGIEGADVFLCCVTVQYCNKINRASLTCTRDNCYKEWSYANARSKRIIPISMEPDCNNPIDWPSGVMQMYLSTSYCFDASGEEEEVKRCASLLSDCLQKRGLVPSLSPIPQQRKWLLPKVGNGSFHNIPLGKYPCLPSITRTCSMTYSRRWRRHFA